MSERLHLLPPNATPLERAISETDARLLDAPTEVVRDVKSPADCPAPLLPYLALERAVRDWDPTWTEDIQRAVIEASYGVRKIAGTRGALEAALAAINVNITVKEWYEYGGAPHRFRIRQTLPAGGGLTVAEQRVIVRVARSSKNVRSRLERLEAAATGSAAVATVGAAYRARLRFRPVAGEISAIALQPFWATNPGLLGAI